jgi:general stress protein 26
MATTTLVPDVDSGQIQLFLAAARDTIADVPFGWLATRSAEGGANARAVKVWPGAPDDDAWTRRVLVRRGSRKVAEIKAAPLVTLAFQHDSGERYVALSGRALLIEDRAEMRSLWSDAAAARFAPGFADQHMMVLKLVVDRIEVHARGVTHEPFGHGRTLLQREAAGDWRFIPDGSSAFTRG